MSPQMSSQKFVKLSDDFFADADYAQAFRKLGMTCLDKLFNFGAGENLDKPHLAKHRTRVKFDLDEPNVTVFLKRYDRPPKLTQLKNWLHHHRRASTSSFDRSAGKELAAAGIDTPQTIAYGEQWAWGFEKCSFIITRKIPRAESLERKLPDFFHKEPSAQNLKQRRAFIERLADFTRQFHKTGFRHCDLYLSHIFFSGVENFYLIDLQRVFRPILLDRRFRIKDISQLYYSAPAKYFSRPDRLRFYLRYAGRKKLIPADKRFIRKVNAAARRIARHDIRHGRGVGFAI